jgi:heme exporter protein A
VSFQVARGEAVGLLGANGSGKSTLLRTLTTLLRPSSGTAQICGYDVVREADDVRRHVGFLAHTPGLYDDLSARENLEFARAMLGRASGDITVGAALDRVGLGGVGDARVRGFSAGMQRRLALARLLLTRPAVLLMDEPYSNLDVEGIALMNAVIGDAVQRGGAALVVLHELAPASGMLDRTITLTGGRIAGADATGATEIVAGATG